MSAPRKDRNVFSRREFLKTMGVLGGGILICCTVGNSLAQEAERPRPRSLYPAEVIQR